MACAFAPSNEKRSRKTPSITQSVEFNEKTGLSVRPDPALACLARDYNPTHIQKIVKEFVLLATGGVAILLQVANPGVGAGVDENSNFAYRPVDRLRTTMTYVYCMAFGTPQERATIIEMVHRAHVPVRGADYTADDPDLQLWVAATLYACGLDIYEKLFGKLDPVEAEEVYKEYSVLATSLRVPEGMWPKTRKDFWAYWDEKIATLQITDHAKSVANDLLFNNHGPLWVRANLPLIRVLSTEWLPPRMRTEYGLKSTKTKRAVYRMTMGVGRTVVPILPAYLREWPKNYYLKDMRKRMKKMQQVI